MTATMTRGTGTGTGTVTRTGTAGGAEAEASVGRRHTVVPTGLGELTVVAEGDALVGVYFPGHRPAPPAGTFGELVDPAETDDLVLLEAAAQLVDYSAGRRQVFDLPVDPSGSERARRVWELIAAVPRGGTTTYAALGRAVGVGPRAAGGFVARNPLSVVVPCHRVVASDGRLTGYAGGLDRKRQLLELEDALPVGAASVRPGADPVPVDAVVSPLAPADATTGGAPPADEGEFVG